MTKLTFDNLTIRYASRAGSSRKDVDAVKNVNLEIESGATLGLAGESGSGKSTLAMSVLRLLPKNAKIDGQILIGDESDHRYDLRGRLRAVRWTDAAIVFQGAMHALNPVQRVRDQISEGLELHARDEHKDMQKEETRYKRVDALLAQVDLPRSKAFSYPHELSGGQKQRIMIAMALACDPDVIIADEPTTALDVIVQGQILDLLKDKVRERGLTLLMISHDLSVLATTCERIAVMYKGELVEHGPSREVMEHPKHEHTAKLAAAFPVIGDWSSRLSLPSYTAPDAPGPGGPGSAKSPQERSAVAATPTEALPLPEVVVAARNVTVEFGSGKNRHAAVKNVDLTCRPGEIIALVGQSGSGKTTLARTILGLQEAASGDVLYRGEPLSKKRRALKEYRRKVQYVLQDPMAALNGRHTVYEQIAEGPRVQGMKGGASERSSRGSLNPQG